MIGQTIEFIYDTNWKETTEWKEYVIRKQQENTSLSLQDVFLPQACLSCPNNHSVFTEEDSTKHIHGFINVHDCWMNNHEYITSHYHITSIEKDVSHHNLQFRYKEKLYSFLCPLYKHASYAILQIYHVLLENRIVVNMKDLQLSFKNAILQYEDSLQSYGINETDIIEVTVIRAREIVYDPLIRYENNYAYREISFQKEEDIDSFITDVNDNAFFPVTHLTLHFGSYDHYNINTTFNQFIQLLKFFCFPNLLVLSLVYDNMLIKEEWKTCFLSSSFPALKDLVVYVLNKDGYMIEDDIIMEDEEEKKEEETDIDIERKKREERAKAMNVTLIGDTDIREDTEVRHIINYSIDFYTQVMKVTQTNYSCYISCCFERDNLVDYDMRKSFPPEEQSQIIHVCSGPKAHLIPIDRNLVYEELVIKVIQV